jgi:hypothetical protein
MKRTVDRQGVAISCTHRGFRYISGVRKSGSEELLIHVNRLVLPFCALFALLLLIVGCQKNVGKPEVKTSAQSVADIGQTVAPVQYAIRINAGATAQLTDSAGHVWLPDTGFKDGETVTRDDSMTIANTSNPALYRTERFGMTAFSQPLANGKYTVRLHFAETSSAISAPGERVFSMTVEGVEIKDLDVWAKAGAREKAYIETIDVNVTDGKLDIVFTPKTQNPEINGIEIIPKS